jgi:hypothetical protein
MFSGDQIIDPAMARALHADMCRTHALVAWAVMWDEPAYPDHFTARLVTNKPLPYVLVSNSLAEIQQQLPAGLQRFERQPVDPPEVLEIWFAQPT